jgi:hypothetical protein
MGTIELLKTGHRIRIHSFIFLYGGSISETIRKEMEEEISTMWNEPHGLVLIDAYPWLVEFDIQVFLFPDLRKEDIMSNRNPRNNYIRVEEYAHGNISFVDGLGCNTGYFKLENLYKNSTTSAHEYGHTLGLPHPHDLDIRGKGQPGIMYPRGTLVDAEFQYDPLVKAGEKGGTIYPIHRKVHQNDIDDLKLNSLIKNKQPIIGKLSSVYHEAHQPGI